MKLFGNGAVLQHHSNNSPRPPLDSTTVFQAVIDIKKVLHCKTYIFSDDMITQLIEQKGLTVQFVLVCMSNKFDIIKGQTTKVTGRIVIVENHQKNIRNAQVHLLMALISNCICLATEEDFAKVDREWTSLLNNDPDDFKDGIPEEFIGLQGEDLVTALANYDYQLLL